MSNDDGWKPKGRPQSTIARNFSASLNESFAMDKNLEGLVQSVEQKKQAVSSRSAELEALEARLRETEERLKEKESRLSSPAGRIDDGTSSPRRREPSNDTHNTDENEKLQQRSVSSLLATQAPVSGNVSSSTMSYWKQAPQEAASRQPEVARDISAEQLSGQQGSRYQ